MNVFYHYALAIAFREMEWYFISYYITIRYSKIAFLIVQYFVIKIVLTVSYKFTITLIKS